MFESAKKGSIWWFGNPDTRIPTIHQGDLGEAFRLVAEKSYAIPGIIFDIANDYPEPLSAILHQLQKVSGAKDINYKEPEKGRSALFINRLSDANAADYSFFQNLTRDWEPVPSSVPH